MTSKGSIHANKAANHKAKLASQIKKISVIKALKQLENKTALFACVLFAVNRPATNAP